MSKSVKPHQHNHFGLKVSIFLSALCLVHCLTFPFLIVLLPLFNIAFHPPAWIEFSLLGATAVLGVYSMRHGINLHYHKYSPLALFLFGIIGFFVVHLFWHTHELNWFKISVDVFFGLIIASSQIINYKLSNRYACTTNHIH